MAVDFPAPLGPNIETISPLSTFTEQELMMSGLNQAKCEQILAGTRRSMPSPQLGFRTRNLREIG